MQKKRVADQTVVFFQRWSLRLALWFKYKFFVFFYRTSLVKLKYVKKLKKRFRKPFRRKKLSFLFYCKPNYLLHRKFKNARMGKGKGSPLIWVYKPAMRRPAAVLSAVNAQRAASVASFLKKFFIPSMYVRAS